MKTQGNPEQDAAGAAARAQVAVVTVDSVADLRRVAEMFSRIWAAPLVPPMPHDIMRSLAHAGGRVHAAFREGELLGAAVAAFGPPTEALCYSLIAGVSPEAQGQGVGLALKLAQRAWALRAGARRMRWTFDPLLQRNAKFNLCRLGTVGTEYLVNFYGEIPDGVNDPETDRLAVDWDLLVPLPGTAEPIGQDAPVVLAARSDGEPAAEDTPQTDGNGPARLRCWIPGDILKTRHTNPALARRWRLAVRQALSSAVEGGYRVTWVTDPGWYLLKKAQA